MKQLFVFIILVGLSNLALSQELSLQECVNIAINNSLDVEQSEYDLQSAQLDYEQSKMNRFPSVNASTSHSVNFGRSLDFTSYEFNTQSNFANSFGASAGATLYSGGRINETIKLQQMLANRTENSVDAIKDQIAITVAGNYLNAVSAKEQIRIAELLVALRKEDEQRTQKLIDNGITAGSAIYDMQGQVANAEFQLQQATNNYELAILELKQTMLYPFEKDIDVVFPESEVPSIDEVRAELHPNEVYRNALLTQGNILGSEQDISIAEQNVKLAEAEKYPTISINGGLNTYHSSLAQEIVGQESVTIRVPIEGYEGPGSTPYLSTVNNVPIQENSPFFSQLNNNLSQNVGVSVQIPIFNRGQVKTQIAKAKYNVEKSKLQSETQKRRLEQTIQNAYMSAELAYKAYKAAETQVNILERTSEFAKKRYDIGSATLYDYFTTQNNLANAKVQLAQAKYDYIYKVKILEFYKENNFEL